MRESIAASELRAGVLPSRPGAASDAGSGRPRRTPVEKWGALALWMILVAYPLSVGPAYYASRRGWIPHGSHFSFYEPLWSVAVTGRAEERLLKRYITWWTLLAERHAADD